MARGGGKWRGRGRSGARWRDSRGNPAAQACQVTSRGTLSIKQERQDEGYGDVKVKSFEEIMAEKRRRRVGQQTAARSSAAPGAAADVNETHSTPGRPKDSPVHSVRSAVSDPGGTVMFPGINNFNNNTGNSNTTQEPWITPGSSTQVPLAFRLKSSSPSSPLSPGTQFGFGTPIVYLDRLSRAQEDELSRVGVIRTPSNSPSPNRGSPSDKERASKSKKKRTGKKTSETKACLGTSGEESTESSIVGKVETDGGSLGKFGDSSGLLALSNLIKNSTNQRPGGSRTVQNNIPTSSTLFSPVASHTVALKLSEGRSPFKLTQQQEVIVIDSSGDESDAQTSGHSSKGRRKKRERKVSGGQHGSSMELVCIKKEPIEDLNGKGETNLSPLPNPLMFPYRNDTKDSNRLVTEILRNGPLTATSSETPEDAGQSSSPVTEQPGTSGSSRNVWDVLSETSSNTSETVASQSLAELFVDVPRTDLTVTVPTVTEHTEQTVPSVGTFDKTQLTRSSSPDSDSYSVLMQSVQEMSKLDKEHQTSTHTLEEDVWSGNTEVTTLTNNCPSLSQPPLVEAELLNGQPELSMATIEPELSMATQQAELSMATLQPELSMATIEPELSMPTLQPVLSMPMSSIQSRDCSIPQTDSIPNCMSSTLLCSTAQLVPSEVADIQNNMDLAPTNLLLDSPAAVETFPNQLSGDDHNRGHATRGTEHISEAESSQMSQDASRGETPVTQDCIEQDQTDTEKNKNPLSKNPEVVSSESEVDMLSSSFQTLAMPVDSTKLQMEKTLAVEDVPQSVKGGEDNFLETEIPTKATSQLEVDIPVVEKQAMIPSPTPVKTVREGPKPPQEKRQSARLRQKSGRTQRKSPRVKGKPPQVGQKSPQVKPDPPQLEQKSPQVKPNPPQLEQKSPRVKPNPPQLEQKSPQVKPNLPEKSPCMGQNSPQVRKKTPPVKTNSPRVEPKSPRVKPSSTRVEQKSPQVRKNSPRVKPNSPQVEQKSPQVKPNSPEKSPRMGRNSPQVKPKAPQVKAKSSDTRKKTPRGERTASKVGQKSSQVGQNSPLKKEPPQQEKNLPELGNNAPQVGQTLPPVEQNSPQLAENSPQLGQKPPQVKPNSPEVKQKSPRVKANSSQVKRKSPRRGQNSPQVRKKTPCGGRSASKVGEKEPPQQEKNSAQLGTNTSQVGHTLPPVEQNSPQLAETSPQLGQKPPQLKPNSPQVKQKSPRVKANSPQVKRKSPRGGQNSPQARKKTPRGGRRTASKVGQSSSQVGENSPLEKEPAQKEQNSPEPGNNAPQVGQMLPPAEQNSPQLVETSPQLGHNPPQKPRLVKPNSPQVKPKSPQVKANSPQVKRKSPRGGQNSPQVRKKAPREGRTASKVGQSSPQVGENSPLEKEPAQQEQNSPQLGTKTPVGQTLPPVEQNSPQLGGNPPQLGGNPPQLGDNPPQLGGNPPQLEGNPPQLGGNPPQLEGNPPQQAGNPPQLGGNPPQLGGNPPQLGGNPPQLGGNPPQLEVNPPQQAGNPPQLGDNPPQLGGNPPQLGGNPPQLGDNPPQVEGKPRKSLSQEDKATKEGSSSSPQNLQQITRTGKRKQNPPQTRKKAHKSHHQKPETSIPFIPLSPVSNSKGKDCKAANSTSKPDKDMPTSAVHRSVRRKEEAATGSPCVFRSDTSGLAGKAGSTISSADLQHSPFGDFVFRSPPRLSRHDSPSGFGTSSTPAYSKENQLARAPSLSPIVFSSSPFDHTSKPKVTYTSRPGNGGNPRLVSLATPPRNDGTSLSACSPFLPESSPFRSPDAGWEVRQDVASTSRDTRIYSAEKTRSFSRSYVTLDATGSESEAEEAAATPESTSARKVKFGMPEDLRVKLKGRQREVKRTTMQSPPAQKSWVSLATGGHVLRGMTSSWKSPVGCSDNDDAISLFVSRDEVSCLLIDDDIDHDTSRDTQWDNSPAAMNSTRLPSVQQVHRQKPSSGDRPRNSLDAPDDTDVRVHRTQGGLIVKLPQKTMMKRKGGAVHNTTGPDDTQMAGPSSPKRLRTAACSGEGARPTEMGRSTGRGDVQQTGQHDRRENRCLPLPYGYCWKHFLTERGCHDTHVGCKFDHRLTSKAVARDLIDYMKAEGRPVPLTVYRDFIRLLIQAGDTAEAVATFKTLRHPRRNSGELTLIVDELTDNLLSMQCWGYLQEVLLLVLQKGIMPNENVLCDLIQHHGDNNDVLAIRKLMDQYDECNVRPGDNVLVLVDNCLARPDRPPSRESLTSEEDVDERHHRHRHFSRVQSERRGISMEAARADHESKISRPPVACLTGIQDKPSQPLWPEEQTGACGTLHEPSRSHTPLGIVNPQPHYTMEGFIQHFQFLAKSRVPMEELGKQLGKLYTSMKATVGSESSLNVQVLRALCDAVSSQECFSEVFHAMVKTLGYAGEDGEIVLYTEDVVPLGRVAVSLLLEARHREAWEQGFYMLYLMHAHSMLYDELPGLSDGWSEEDQWQVSNAALQMCLKSDNVGSALEVLKGRDDSWQCPPESLGPVFEERRCLLQEILTAVTLTTENAEDYFTLMDTIKDMGVNLAQQWMEILKQNLSDETVNLVALVSEQMMRRGLLDVRSNEEENMREILSSLVDVLGRNELEDEARKIFLHGCLQGMYKIPVFPGDDKHWDLSVPSDLKTTEMHFYVERHFQFLGHDLMKGKFEGNHLTITLGSTGDAEGSRRLTQALQDGFGFKPGVEFIGQVVRGCFTVVMYFCAILDWLQRMEVVVDGSTSGLSEYEMEDDSPERPGRPPSLCSVDTHFTSLTNVVNRIIGNNEEEEGDSPAADLCNPDVLNRQDSAETQGKQNESTGDRGHAPNTSSYLDTIGQANPTQIRHINSILPPAQLHSSNPAGYVRAENREMQNRSQVFNQPRNVPRPAHTMQQFGSNGGQPQPQAQVHDRRGTQHIPELLSLQTSSSSTLREYNQNSILGEYGEPSQGPYPNLRGGNLSGAQPQPCPYPVPQRQPAPGRPRFPVARAMPSVGSQPCISRKDHVSSTAGYYTGDGQLQGPRNNINNPAGFRMGSQRGHRSDVNIAARFPMGPQQGRRNDMNNTAGFRMGPPQGGRNDINRAAGLRMGPHQGGRNETNSAAGIYVGPQQGRRNDPNSAAGHYMGPQQGHRNDPNSATVHYMGPQQGRRYLGQTQHSQARGDGSNWRQGGGRSLDTPSPPPPPPPPPLPSHQGYIPGMASPPKSFKTVSRPQQGAIDIFIRRIREEIESRVRMCTQIDEEHVSTLGCRLLDGFLQEEGQALFKRPQFNMELQRRIFKFVDCNYRQEYARLWMK